MLTRTLVLATALAALGASTQALAQQRGRTDGPEGSEYGKGGYDRVGAGPFSLHLDWGASFSGGSTTGAPLFAGLTASYWGAEYYQLDLSGQYLANNGRIHLLLGPRFRTGTYPVSGFLGVQAGAALIPNLGVRFLVSPSIGADLMVARHLLLGLGYAPDLAFGGGAIDHRVFMRIGYRF